MRIDQIIKIVARNKPDKVALVDTSVGDRKITYSEYEQMCINFANYIVNDFKINPEERIALLLENSIEICIAYYSIPRTSAITVPMNFFMARKEIEYCLNDCKPIMLIYGDRFKEDIPYYKDKCPFIKEFISEDKFNELCQIPFDGKRIKPPKKVTSEDIVFIAYTGGTTGFPKGVMLTHQGLTENMSKCSETILKSLRENPKFEEHGLSMLEDTLLIPIPIFHLAAMITFLIASSTGYSLYLQRGFKAEKIVQTIEKHKITHLVCVPTNIISLIDFLESDDAQKYDISSLRNLTYGASPISPFILQKALKMLPNTRFRQAYGQTEYSPVITQLTSEDHEYAKQYPEILKSGGRAQVGTELGIIGKNGNFLQRGKIGEVVASGRSIMKGYWNKEDLTQDTIREIDGKRWLFTGDVGYLKEINGREYLFLTDRAKDMIVSGGENIYPKEIENVIYRHKGVKFCSVIGVPDEKWGEKVLAFVVPKEGFKLDKNEIISYCGDNLAGYKKPKQIIFRDSLPMSGQGKILKKELRAKYWKGKERLIH
jgi:acyl-CoA synthetase (AMP-forming)/AMP-acid ligase II